MSRGQKIQEVLIQIFVFFYALMSFGDLSYRPFFNQFLGLCAVSICMAAFLLHILNWWKKDRYFKARRMRSLAPLGKFLAGMAGLFFVLYLLSKLPFLTGAIYLAYLIFPLLFLYPIFYFWRWQWKQRAILLAGIVLMVYSQMALLKNDRLHQVLNYAVRSNQFGPHLVSQFEVKSLTPEQANDLAWVLTVHPDESLRNYDKAIEFATIGLKRETRDFYARNLADTLTCAYLGKKNKHQAKMLIEKYELSSRTVLLEEDVLCESAAMNQRSPASQKKKRKYKYYY